MPGRSRGLSFSLYDTAESEKLHPAVKEGGLLGRRRRRSSRLTGRRLAVARRRLIGRLLMLVARRRARFLGFRVDFRDRRHLERQRTRRERRLRHRRRGRPRRGQHRRGSLRLLLLLLRLLGFLGCRRGCFLLIGWCRSCENEKRQKSNCARQSLERHSSHPSRIFTMIMH
jgi:hypothetical protein